MPGSGGDEIAALLGQERRDGLRILAPRLGFETPDTVFLDDIIIDTNQCIRQGQILSEVLGGLMDARGNIINNNMTVLLKKRTKVCAG